MPFLTTIALAAAALGGSTASPARPDKPVSIVLVHGGFVDGSGWQAVHKILKNDGYDVVVVQNPTVSLADDVAVTKRAIAAAKYPVVLVGHSYGGAVISEAGNDPKVRSLAYIAAFAPDAGECQHLLHAARRLAQALLILDQREADEAFAFLAEADAGRDRDMGFGQQALGEFHAAEVAEGSGIGAQANMLAIGTGMSQPARPKQSTSTSRRFL
jgi:pimeloyl-ACP methyl ester carboxylesterase